MRISDWSSDVCSSDLLGNSDGEMVRLRFHVRHGKEQQRRAPLGFPDRLDRRQLRRLVFADLQTAEVADQNLDRGEADGEARSEEHTSELQSLMRISYAVFCLTKKKHHVHNYSK